MKLTIAISILLTLLVNLVKSKSTNLNVSQLLENCCAEGLKKDSLDIECSNLYISNPELGPLDRECSQAFSNCCVIKQTSLYCDKGKELAVQDGHCIAARSPLKPTGEPVPGGQMLHDCCRLCEGERYLTECPVEGGPTLFGKAIKQCCEESKGGHFEPEGTDLCSGCQHGCATSKDHCTCRDGYELAEDRHSCLDIDECLVPEICGRDEECANYDGTYECVKCHGRKFHTGDHLDELEDGRQDEVAWDFGSSVGDVECGVGFEYDQLAKTCVDVNECEHGDYVCWENTQCVNNDGSYTCEQIHCDEGMIASNGGCETPQCPSGSHYDEVWESCESDECLKNPCSTSEACRNAGSYICESKSHCPVGTRQHFLFCVDIDECRDSEQACQTNEICVNTVGSFRCKCAKGFERQDGACQDVDECSLAKSVCSAETPICINNHGSYECECKPGFERDQSNPNQCNNINECLDLTTCPPEATCFDSQGSFTCICPDDLVLTENNTCELPAPEAEKCHGKRVVDEQSKKYTCTCPDGFNLTRDSTGVYCEDYDECDYGKIACPGEDHICVNTFGSHKCIEVTCPENYIKKETERACVHDKFATGNCTSGGGACTKNANVPSSISFRHVTMKSNISSHASKETPLQIYSLPGIHAKPRTTYRFAINITNIDSSPLADQLVKEDFIMQETDQNSFTRYKEAILFLTKPIIGPSDIALTIDVIATMKRGHRVKHINVHRTNLFIYVSAYDGQNFE
ncbi:Fibulin-1 [Halotydeus destructor]|nr:Fibulin-1 [Halotydeus destructor]